MNFGKNPQHDIPKMRGGGVNGHLEHFRKFIHFGRDRLPLQVNKQTNATKAKPNFMQKIKNKNRIINQQTNAQIK